MWLVMTKREQTERPMTARKSWRQRLFGLSLIGVIVSVALALLLIYHAAILGPGLRELALLAGAGLIGYALLAMWAARRMDRRRIAELNGLLNDLRRARRAAEEALQARTFLSAAITHELRTPVSGVVGMAGLLRDTDLTPEQESYVTAIETSGRALLSMVDELLDTAQADDNDFSIRPAAFEVARLVEDVCELMAPRAHAKDIDLASFISPDIPARVEGDAARIRQVLLNLVGNAIRFTDDGGVLVRAEAAEDGVAFGIIDSGPGIAQEEQAAIFEPHAQTAHGRARGGSGLGLAISKRLVARMGGVLRVDSRPGEGARFHFTLPLPAAGDGGPAAPGERCDGARILLAVEPGVRRTALADYVAAYQGTPVILRDEAALKAALGDAAASRIICDARHADLLRRELARNPQTLRRVWLLLKPEERRALRDLVEEEALGGFLLMPLRRATFVAQVVEQDVEGRIARAATRLRRLVADDAPSPPDGGPVLLAEDDPVNALLATRRLQQAGFAPLHVSDGAAAVAHMEKLLQANDVEALPRFIILDVHMPGMDGPAAAQRIRQLERAHHLARRPILALTASGGDDSRARCLAAGMDGVLRKPFDADGVREMLRDIEMAGRAGAPM
ncbi:MAG TPA: response regulator [Thermopetrobacter sp.]|nr:response regulator [Thermopetrobacter sp.]